MGSALITQIAHAQAGGKGQVEGVLIKMFECVRASLEKAGLHRWGGAEQIHQQPAVAFEITNQGHIAS
ncbi:hypothetical protein D3C81_1389410 [compost metagenome]